MQVGDRLVTRGVSASFEFNPDQPRGADGKWGGDGGSTPEKVPLETAILAPDTEVRTDPIALPDLGIALQAASDYDVSVTEQPDGTVVIEGSASGVDGFLMDYGFPGASSDAQVTPIGAQLAPVVSTPEYRDITDVLNDNPDTPVTTAPLSASIFLSGAYSGAADYEVSLQDTADGVVVTGTVENVYSFLDEYAATAGIDISVTTGLLPGSSGGVSSWPEALTIAENCCAAWYNSLGANAQSTLKEYTSDFYYEVNGYLRGTMAAPGDPTQRTYLDSRIQQLDSAMSSQLPQDMTLYRGFSDPQLADLISSGNAVGAIMSQPAYTSTSVIESVGRSFARADGYVMQISAPAGTRGAWGNLTRVFPTEGEFILPRDVQIRIAGVDSSVFPPVIQAELVTA